MAIEAVVQFLPAPPPSQTSTTHAPGVSFEAADRQSKGAVHRRPIEQNDSVNPRYRRRALDTRTELKQEDSATDHNDNRDTSSRGEFGFHLGINAFPERVLHSSAFIAQLIGQQFAPSKDVATTDSGSGATAYGAAVERVESYFGAFEPIGIAA